MKKNDQLAKPPQRWRPTPLFLLLVALSLLFMGAGIWQLQVGRQRIAAESQPAASGITPSVAPDFVLPKVEGDKLRLRDLRGQVVLLNFWATWCPPCKAEMPDLEALHREHADSQGFTVIGINMDEDAALVAAFAESYGISFPLLLDSDSRVTSNIYAVRSLPTSMIIDREGLVRDLWLGQISKEAMLARLRRVW